MNEQPPTKEELDEFFELYWQTTASKMWVPALKEEVRKVFQDALTCKLEDVE